MTSGYYCAIFPFCGGGKKKDDKKTKAFYDWATTGIPVMIMLLHLTRVDDVMCFKYIYMWVKSEIYCLSL